MPRQKQPYDPIGSILKRSSKPSRPLSEIVAKGVLNLFVITLSVIMFLIFIVGSYDYFKNIEGNKCAMTYMYEYPEYVRIRLDSDLDKKYPNYGLYAYAEGKYVGPATRHKFTGIPVLFVPGNAGSHRQVRSFASVALRKWLDSRTPFHFDFFSLDFNEELSGVYGYVLNAQSEYLKAAIVRIQSFYEEYHSVALIGHSMGGILAKSLKEHNEPLSNLIISLSTPHVRPIFVFDPEQDLFHYHLIRNWSRGDEKFRRDVTLVSIAGGDRDIMVPEGFTKWGRHLDIHTTTTAIPGVWASTDHLCIVWCKQFVLSLVRSLFDLVEYRKKNGFYALTENTDLREEILRYHLIKRTSGKSFHGAHPLRTTELGVPPETGYNELLIHNFCSLPSRSTTYLMFPMHIIKEKMRGGDPDDYNVLVLSTNTEPKNWVFGCTSQSFAAGIRYCSLADNLSLSGEILPHYRRRRKINHLKFSEISKYSHILVKMDPSNVKTCVNLEVYNPKDRSQAMATQLETQGKIFYNFTMPINTGIFSKLFAWRVVVYPVNGSSCDGSYNSLMTFQHGNFKLHRFPKNETMNARVSDFNLTSANVQMYLEPSCNYNVQVLLGSIETAGQFFRAYFRLLPSFFGSIILLSLYFQKRANDWSNFHRVLLSNAYNLTVFPGMLISFFLVILPNDWPHMLDGPEYFLLLPLFCYLIAYSLLMIVVTGVWYIIIMSGNLVHSISLRMLSTRFAKWTNLNAPLPDQIADLALNITFAKFPVIITVFLTSMTLATCGGFGFLAGMCFFVIKLFKLYEDLLAELWKGKFQNVADGLSPVNFQFSCAMLWFLLTAFNFPSLIHWVKSFSADTSPQWDVSMYLCLMSLPALAVLWQDYSPRFNASLWRVHRYVFYAMGLAIVIWGTFRLYLAGFVIVIVLLTTAMCQLISSIETEEETVAAAAFSEQEIRADDEDAQDLLEESKSDDTTDTELGDAPGLRPSYEFEQETDETNLSNSRSESESNSRMGSVNQSDLELEAEPSNASSEPYVPEELQDGQSNSQDDAKRRNFRSKSKSRSIEKKTSEPSTSSATLGIDNQEPQELEFNPKNA